MNLNNIEFNKIIEITNKLNSGLYKYNSSIQIDEPDKSQLLWGDQIENKIAFDILVEPITDGKDISLYTPYVIETVWGTPYTFNCIHFEKINARQYYLVIYFNNDYNVPLNTVLSTKNNFWANNRQWRIVAVPNVISEGINNTRLYEHCDSGDADFNKLKLNIREVNNIPRPEQLSYDPIDPVKFFGVENSPVYQLLEMYINSDKQISSQYNKAMNELTAADTEEIIRFLEYRFENYNSETERIYESLEPILDAINQNVNKNENEKRVSAAYNSLNEQYGDIIEMKTRISKLLK